MFTGPRVDAVAPPPSTESFLGFFTMTNASTSSQSAEVFQLAFPVASQSGSIRIYTSDTAGNSASALTTFGVDATSSDMTGAVRLQIISGVTAISGSQTLKFWVYDSPTAPPTGSSITSASLLSTSWRISASVNIGGTTHIVDTNTFGSATTSFSASQVVYHGRFMDNPFRACHVWSAPVQSGGAGMRLWFHVYASKTASGAVSTSNAILPVETDLVFRNFDAVRTTPSAYYYGLTIARATSMTDGTLITTDQTDFDGNVTRMVYARSSPSATLTLSSTAVGAVNISRSTGSWDTDVLGAHFRPVTSSSTAAAYVTARTSNTTVSAYIYSAFSTNSFASGAWVQEGVGHPYGSTWTIPVVVGAMPTCAAVWGNNTSAITPTTTAGRDYLNSVKAINNFAFPFADAALDMTNLNAMKADSAMRPFTQLGPTGTLMGDVATQVGAVADRDDIGFMSAWCVNAITKPTADGRRKLRENGLWYHTAWYLGGRRYSGSPSAGALGVAPRADCGTDFAFNGAFSSVTVMTIPSTTWNAFDGDNSHQPEAVYAPYLYFGRLIYLERLQENVFYYCNVTPDPAYQGAGINKTPFGDGSLVMQGDAPWGSSLQQRAEAWLLRDLILAGFITPDASNDLIYNAKTMYTTYISNTWKRAGFVQTNYTNGTGDEDYYDTDGPRYVGFRFNGNIDYGPWQTRYADWVINSAIDYGMTTGTTSGFAQWMSVGYVGLSQSADVAPDYISTAYFTARTQVDGSNTKLAAVQSWADSYRAWMCFPPNTESSPEVRTPSGITLSTTSGSITVTLTGGPLGAGSWYANDGGNFLGGWVFQLSGGTGKGQVQSVANSNSCVISTSVTGGSAFSTTSPVASTMRIPMPNPADAPAAGTLSGRDTAYMELYRLAGVLYADRGIDTADCVTYIEGSTGFPATIRNKFNIDSR